MYHLLWSMGIIHEPILKVWQKFGVHQSTVPLHILFSRAVVRTNEAEGMRYEWLMPKEEGAEAIRMRSMVVREWSRQRVSLRLAGTGLASRTEAKAQFLTFSASSLFLQCFLQLALSFVDACSYRWLLFSCSFLQLALSFVDDCSFLQLALSFVDACSHRWLLVKPAPLPFCGCLFRHADAHSRWKIQTKLCNHHCLFRHYGFHVRLLIFGGPGCATTRRRTHFGLL
jgi:hypothetical protein